MRHRVKTVKLQRKAAHRRSLLANLACSLIDHGRIRTTLAKAKALRPVADRMVTLGKRGDLHARRQAVAFLHQKEIVKKLFNEVAPAAADRRGGYCRITKLGPRPSDAAPMAFIEWVDRAVAEGAAEGAGATEAAVAETPAAKAPARKGQAAKGAAAQAAEAAGEEPPAAEPAGEETKD